METSRITIRPRIPRDAPFLRALGDAALGEYDAKAGDFAVSSSDRATTLVAVDGERPVGFVRIEQPRDDSFHLAAIAVLETARGIGIGEILVRAAERHARARGASHFDLTTADSNVAALSLFRRVGFREKRGAEGTYRRGQRTVQLEKYL